MWAFLKCELLQKSRLVNIITENKLEVLARKYGHQVLWQPVKHCDLNPIELIWAQVKGYVAKHNTTFNMADTFDLLNKSFDEITVENWKKMLRSCNKFRKLLLECWQFTGWNRPCFVINAYDSDSDWAVKPPVVLEIKIKYYRRFLNDFLRLDDCLKL